jgi:hypothetical protein
MTDRLTLETLADHLLDPIGAKLSDQQQAGLANRIVEAFEQVNVKEMENATRTEFESTAVLVLKPVQPNLGEAEFARMADRLAGSMSS